MTNKILMCPPTYFEVAYDINPWMSDNVGSNNREIALLQWEELYNAIAKVIKVDLIEPVAGLPDMVFTANAGLVVNKKFFLSRFKHSQRTGEELHFKYWFLNDQYCNIEQTKYTFEGEGDCLRDSSGVYWMGQGYRTDSNYITVLTEFGLDARAVQLVDSRFYHIDTCFCPFPDGRLMYYPDAFSEESQKTIEKHFRSISDKEIIRVGETEALTFCCNSVIIGNDVFMTECTSISRRLTGYGYNVHQFNMSEFLKAGGACKCLTLHLNYHN